MFHCRVWDGIDRPSFFENAMLLSDPKHRSQGAPIRMRRGSFSEQIEPGNVGSILLQMTPDFLDDFALVASGSGGPKNVTAACLEFNAESQTHMIRVARNEHPDGCTLDGLRDIIDTAFTHSTPGSFSFLD